MEDYEFDTARAAILERESRFAEAAGLRFSEGQVVEAIDLFLRDGTDVSRSRAESCLLDSLWALLPFGVSIVDLRQSGNFKQLELLESLLHLCDSFTRPSDTSSHKQDQVSRIKPLIRRTVKS